MSLIGSCALSTVRPSGDVETSGALLKAAVRDAEESARWAHAYAHAYMWDRADRELDEAQVILAKASDSREKIRSAYRAAVALIAELRTDAGGAPASPGAARSQAQGFELTKAIDRVDRIGAALVAADRDVEKIERSVIAVLDLDLPNRR